MIKDIDLILIKITILLLTTVITIVICNVKYENRKVKQEIELLKSQVEELRKLK